MRWTSFRPPSVTHTEPSGESAMTPCGAEPGPRSISITSPVLGLSCPNVPLPWPVYQTTPAGDGATSCGRAPLGTSYSTSS
jgi:hypothetical protein